MTSRNLTLGEIALAQQIFGNTIDYNAVRIHNDKYISTQPNNTVITPNGEIYYPSGLYASDLSTGSSSDKALFMHEMAHVMQEQAGMYVKLQRVADGNNYNYDAIFHGTPFHELPMEAQAEFLEDIFRKLNSIPVDANKAGGRLENAARDVSEYLAVAPADLPIANPGEGSTGDLNDGPDFFIPIKMPSSWLPQDVDGPFSDAEPASSPLIVDLDNDGIEVTEFDSEITTTFFDIDNDGFREQTAWVSTDDGLLVRDINNNGSIDNASELFGSATTDGFAILAALDTSSDHVIDVNDINFSDLMIWKDVNSDGYSQEDELKSLGYWDIESISLAGITASTSTIMVVQ